MQSNGRSKLVEIVRNEARELLADWMKQQCAADTLRPNLMNERELREQSQQFLRALSEAVQHGSLTDIQGPAWAAVRELLEHISNSRATQGFTSAETATFVFSLKQPLFIRLRRAHGQDVDGLADDIWQTTMLLDALGLYSTEVYQKSREAIIGRQQQELLELSTPVVQLWDDVLALPLIGTLDSAPDPDGHGEPPATHCRDWLGHRHYRHYWRATGGHPGGATSAQNRGGGPADGR